MLSNPGKGVHKGPREGDALEDKKKLEECPFRRELEELLSSPILKEGDLLEEGEIEVCHPPPCSPAKLGGDNLQELMTTECDTQERVCTPLKMVKASPAEIAAKVMASIDKAEKSLALPHHKKGIMGNGRFKKRREGGKKTRRGGMWDS